jgi:hypothetical protein
MDNDSPDKTADGIERIGMLAHVWVEGDHGRWKVTVGWGGAGTFQGEGESLLCAYRAALNKMARERTGHPGLHNLAAAVTPGMLGLPAECHDCEKWRRWQIGRTTTDWLKKTPSECSGCER